MQNYSKAVKTLPQKECLTQSSIIIFNHCFQRFGALLLPFENKKLSCYCFENKKLSKDNKEK